MNSGLGLSDCQCAEEEVPDSGTCLLQTTGLLAPGISHQSGSFANHTTVALFAQAEDSVSVSLGLEVTLFFKDSTRLSKFLSGAHATLALSHDIELEARSVAEGYTPSMASSRHYAVVAASLPPEIYPSPVNSTDFPYDSPLAVEVYSFAASARIYASFDGSAVDTGSSTALENGQVVVIDGRAQGSVNVRAISLEEGKLESAERSWTFYFVQDLQRNGTGQSAIDDPGNGDDV